MIYLPDTNAFSVHLRGCSPALSERMVSALEAGELRLSVVVLCELAYGAQKAALIGEKRPAARVARLREILSVEPLTVEAAARYAQIRAHLERCGQLTGGMDLLLAAHALAIGATVITANTSEFRRVPSLKVDDWQRA